MRTISLGQEIRTDTRSAGLSTAGTGIKGRFDFDVEFAIDQGTPGFVSEAAPTDPAVGVSIFTAVQEQLGQGLESTKGPGEFLVVDHVEKPSEK